jgi:hypothetical protein
MPKAETELQKHTMNLYLGDYARLQDLYPEIGASVVIRRIIRAWIEKAEATGEQAPDQIDISI